MQACGRLKASFIPSGSNVRSIKLLYIIKSCLTVSWSLIFIMESLYNRGGFESVFLIMLRFSIKGVVLVFIHFPDFMRFTQQTLCYKLSEPPYCLEPTATF